MKLTRGDIIRKGNTCYRVAGIKALRAGFGADSHAVDGYMLQNKYGVVFGPHTSEEMDKCGYQKTA